MNNESRQEQADIQHEQQRDEAALLQLPLANENIQSLIRQAAKFGHKEEIITYFRLAWMRGDFQEAIDPFVWESIANLCSESVELCAIRDIQKSINESLRDTIEYKLFYGAVIRRMGEG